MLTIKNENINVKTIIKPKTDKATMDGNALGDTVGSVAGRWMGRCSKSCLGMRWETPSALLRDDGWAAARRAGWECAGRHRRPRVRSLLELKLLIFVY